MSTTYDLKVLRRIAIFVLNRSSQDLRSELHDYLVMVALSDDKKRSGMTKAQIVDSIKKDIKISELPEVLIRNSLNRLRKGGFVNAVHSKGISYSHEYVPFLVTCSHLYFRHSLR